MSPTYPTYDNGKKYATDCSFAVRKGVPYLNVEMSPQQACNFVPVIGRLNTGIRNSIMEFKTAYTLGIKDPKSGIKTSFQLAIKRTIKAYQHALLVRVRNPQGYFFEFNFYPAFSDSVTGNYFGMDWTLAFCIALDRERTHLLRD